MGISEMARQARNAYERERYRKNREHIRRQQEEYWERKAAQMNGGVPRSEGVTPKAVAKEVKPKAVADEEVILNPSRYGICVVPVRWGKHFEKRILYFSYLSSRTEATDGRNSYLILKREPKNPADKNAVEVLSRGEIYGPVGYVGKEYAELISNMIENKEIEIISVTGSDNIDDLNNQAWIVIQTMPRKKPGRQKKS